LSKEPQEINSTFRKTVKENIWIGGPSP